jgi:hypothetical protein
VTASSFIIEQKGVSGGRKLILTGRSLPYRPLDLAASAKVELTWLPGSQVATANVIGPRVDATTIRGMWKDKYIGDPEVITAVLDGAPVNTVLELHETIEAMREEIQLVEVTWGAHIRRGFIVAYKPQFQNEHDMEWEITFDWVSKNPPQVQAEVSDSPDTNSAVQRLIRMQAGVVRAADLATLTLSPSFNLDQLFQTLNDIADLVDAAFDAVSNAVTVGMTALTMARRVAGLFEQVKDRCDELREQIAGNTANLIELISEVSPPAGERIAQLAAQYGLDRQVRNMASFAAYERGRVLAQLNARLLASYTAREGDDLRDVARQFYGSTLGWRRLLVFNGLTSAELVAGQVVLVPADDADQSGATTNDENAGL